MCVGLNEYIERITQRSSATDASCGSTLLTSMPLCPRFWNSNGVGISPPQASWGEMLTEATPIFATAWWFFVFPGLALLLTVLAFNLLGDALRDATDPTLRTGRRRVRQARPGPAPLPGVTA